MFRLRDRLAGPSSGSHEAYVDHTPVKQSSNRSFGLTVGSILLAIGLVKGLVYEAPLANSALFAGPGVLLILLGLVVPDALAPLNRLWTKLGLLLARIANPIIMALMFLVIFIPPALIMRMRGRDPLRQKLDPGSESYWIERDRAQQNPKTMTHQF